MLAAVFGLWKLADSKFGLVLHAIRDDEVAARASGINTPRYKLIVFAVSAAVAGLAGALFAHVIRVAGPSALEVALSFQVVIWGIFGGVATIYGPVAAVFILYPLTEWLGSFKAFGELRLLIFAVIVLVVLSSCRAAWRAVDGAGSRRTCRRGQATAPGAAFAD